MMTALRAVGDRAGAGGKVPETDHNLFRVSSPFYLFAYCKIGQIGLFISVSDAAIAAAPPASSPQSMSLVT